MNWRSRPTVIAASSTSRRRRIQAALAQGQTTQATRLLCAWLQRVRARRWRRRPVEALELCVALLLHPATPNRVGGSSGRVRQALLRRLGLSRTDRARVLAAVAEALLVRHGPAAAWPWLSQALSLPKLGDSLRSLLLLSYGVHEWAAGRVEVAESTFATVARWSEALPYARHHARMNQLGIKVARGARLTDAERAHLFSPSAQASEALQAPVSLARAHCLSNEGAASALVLAELEAAERYAEPDRLDVLVEARLMRVNVLLTERRFRTALDTLDALEPLVPPDAVALQAQLARGRGLALLTTAGRERPEELPEGFGPPLEAIALLEHAEALFDQAGRDHESISTQASLLIAHARAGQTERALERARQLQQRTGSDAAEVVLQAAASAAACGRATCALVLAEQLPATMHADAVLIKATALEQLGQQAEAVRLIESSAAAPEATDDLRREARLWALARTLASGALPSEQDRAFLFAEATLHEAGAQRIHNLRGRWWLFVGAAESAAQAFEAALDALDPVLSPVTFVGAAELWMLARTLSGDTTGLDNVVHRLLAAGNELPPLPRASLLLRVGNILAAAGQHAAARQALQSIIDALQPIVPPPPLLTLAELGAAELRCLLEPRWQPEPTFWEERLARFAIDTHPSQRALLLACRGRITRSLADLTTAAELMDEAGNHHQALLLWDEAASLAAAEGNDAASRRLRAQAAAMLPELLQVAPSDASRVGILARSGELLVRQLSAVADEAPSHALDLVQFLRSGALEQLRKIERTEHLSRSAPETLCFAAMPPVAQQWEMLTHDVAGEPRPRTRPTPAAPDIGSTARALAPHLTNDCRRFVEIQLLDERILFLIVHPGARVEARFGAWTAGSRELLDELRHRLRSPIPSSREMRVLELGLRRLHALLVEPWIEAVPEGAQLLLSHGASLAQVPWAALPDAAGRPLLERHALCFAMRAGEWPRLLAPEPVIVRSAVVLRGDDRLAGLPPLSHADAEVRQSLALLRGRGIDIPNEETDTGVEQLAAAQLVHYAGHARFDTDHGMGSAIYPPFGPLSAVALMRLRLPPHQVWVLSGCETTRPDDRRGEESVGLLRPLLASGAAAVLGSLWPVDDATTSTLVLRILERWLNGTPLTDSWREEALALLRAGAYHPAIWANLVPYGWVAGARRAPSADAMLSPA